MKDIKQAAGTDYGQLWLRGATMGARLCLVLLLLLPLIAAQTTQPPDVWEPLRYFVGAWKGTAHGQPGNGKVERKYEFILNGKYLSEISKSIYLPQEKNPKGEVHEQRSLFSYDRIRKQVVLRQFHVEGFVNQYLLDGATSNSKTLVFVSESIENIPAGWRARETYHFLSHEEFIEVFELAAPGKEFEVYSENRFKRRGSLH
jgi:hypothetical protein